MYKNKITQALLLGAGLAVATTSFTSFAANVPAGTKLAPVQELVRGNGTEVASLDPHKTEGVPESNVIRDLLEGLVNQDANGNVVPGVAESWETTDNKTFTFHIRKEAKWSNGDPVTAHDFVYSFQRAVDPATASPYSWYMEYTKMKNAKEIIAGEKDKSTLGVKALDDKTLVFELESAVPYFVMMMGHTTVKPVHKATVEKFGEQWTKPENYVGNGAFVLEKWVVNERLELKRNPQYWDDKNTVLNKVTYLPIENQVAEMNRFLSGEIQITNELPLEHFKRLKKEHPESVQVQGQLCTYYYGFNNKKPPFDDVRVRQALSYAIDRDVVSDAILGQGQKPAYFLTPEITAGFSPEMPAYGKMTQKERIAEAKKLLEEAGYNKSNPLKFTLLYNTSENHKKIATAVQSMWKTSLGVDIALENQEWKTYLDTRRQGNFDVTRAGWCGDYNEASSFLTLMLSSNTSNDPQYHNAEYDAVIEKAMTSTSEEERQKLYADAEKLLARDMPIAPIYQYVRSRLVSPTVGGYPSNNAEDKIYMKDLYIKAQ
ncbi:oligopeptide ABC transporter substrate-binding protein OppA [Vibrio tarriae]|uniref:Oligopeptide ABC transporter substrate-binding protein OppA n=1 Tax=Vibrio tarriae TaxID=2014742 RepID=A0AAU8WH53_9VIBR|nr:ABC transporter substrate-binding protein [Vibrio tarriae]QEO46373.1 oligopeptide ABC transporter substrate-binding protein OppA [Vibrio cholerae]ASK55712.1 oligopeptide ABC transporter substrate-binding protein OppA [Vibrio tarriae]RBM30375.1 oligopeptide ABC transporter substrate-binding protein OppA [Vibrio tarriae]RBM31907.1 oligopeptide ABC transporter substrate-binding protein OppA [Vibrio tarriae]RBM37071.1 oligopeptide ABC transporter substrate-binding protein OppA [Vibrio tarriae]